MLRLVIFCGLVALASCQTTAVSQCLYQNAPLPINTYISGCETPPCRLHSLSYVQFHMVFKAPRTIRSMRTVAIAYLFGPLGITHDLEEDAITCNYLTNTYCPVLKDEVVTYTLVMQIEPTFPVGISVTIEFHIRDEADNSPILCIRVPITIVAALPDTSMARGNSTIIL